MKYIVLKRDFNKKILVDKTTYYNKKMIVTFFFYKCILSCYQL